MSYFSAYRDSDRQAGPQALLSGGIKNGDSHTGLHRPAEDIPNGSRHPGGPGHLELPGSLTARLTAPAFLGQRGWYYTGNGGERDGGLREVRKKEQVRLEPLGGGAE